MEYKNRKTVNEKLKKFCYLAKDNDFIEVTEWSNGEGWDVSIGEKIFSLTRGELDALHFLTLALDKNITED